ncbi:MAG TPA: biotin/lipoyl-containing protein [Ktedonobacteraceae bacterium]|nr:biotin/lipoyl-containing protein [Ktedonobacteraceae bacterium]
MAGNNYEFPYEVDAEAEAAPSLISIEQLQRLVQALDSSDISELELQRETEGVHLVLRKIKAPETHAQSDGTIVMAASSVNRTSASPPEKFAPEETHHKVVAPLVGTFHVWAKPRGGALVAVGDRVKAGQLVGTIESLNVLNEVETTVAGRVIEMHVQDGQPVEYGQALMTIDSAEGAKKA